MLAAGYQNETFAGDVKLSTQGNKAKIQYDPNAESSFEGLSQVIRDLGDRTK